MLDVLIQKIIAANSAALGTAQGVFMANPNLRVLICLNFLYLIVLLSMNCIWEWKREEQSNSILQTHTCKLLVLLLTSIHIPWLGGTEHPFPQSHLEDAVHCS